MGFVVCVQSHKKASPSSGLFRVEVYNEHGKTQRNGTGSFSCKRTNHTSESVASSARLISVGNWQQAHGCPADRTRASATMNEAGHSWRKRHRLVSDSLLVCLH